MEPTVRARVIGTRRTKTGNYALDVEIDTELGAIEVHEVWCRYIDGGLDIRLPRYRVANGWKPALKLPRALLYPLEQAVRAAVQGMQR